MKIALVCAAAVALSLAACSGNQQSTTSTNTAAPGASAAAMATETPAGVTMGTMHASVITVVMKEQGGSGESGTATLTAMGKKTRVNIGLKGENTTGDQPAHIHMGACAKPGAVKYPLKNVVLGKSNTVVDAPISSLTSAPMSINVHESAKNLAHYVACGDIKK